MMTAKKTATVSIVCTSLLLAAGCQTVEKTMEDMGITKEGLGTAVGAIGGAVAGSYIGGGAGRYVAIAGGALAGGYFGKLIGAHLEARDQAAVANKSAQAFNNAVDGEAVQWVNPDTKASATLTPRNTRIETRNMKIARLKSVQAPGEMALIGKPYAVKGTSVNVRSGPSARNPIIHTVRKGEIYNAVGRVKGTPWIMVASKGKSFGYIHDSLLVPASETEVNAEIDKRIAAKQTASAVDLDVIDLDAMAPTLRETDAVDLDAKFANDKDVVVEVASVATECRELQATVSTPNDQSKSSFTACKAPDGAWELN